MRETVEQPAQQLPGSQAGPAPMPTPPVNPYQPTFVQPSAGLRGKARWDALMRDLDYLTEASNDEGYAHADVVPRTEPREETQTVDVTYQITKHKTVYFNRIYITGNTKTRDKVIRRELDLVEGDLYSRTKLKKSYIDRKSVV